MFSKGYELASKYTHPVIISTRTIENVVDCSGGAFVIINNEGWFITAAHILNQNFNYQDDKPSVLAFKQEVKKIQQNNALNSIEKKRRIKKLKKNPNWLTEISYWWDSDNRNVVDIKILAENDLAVGRFEPFDPNSENFYPTFKNPDNIMPGTSLCKLGYPFHKISATYNAEINAFELCDGALPVPRFPIEGIYTRNIVNTDQNGKISKFLETSSPGLRGQSGGPIFDSEGIIWAIQSHTTSIPLEFSTEEKQYINVGRGVHPEVIIDFLTKNGIKVMISD